MRTEIREIDGGNFRAALELEVTPEQTAFVASTARYLALCAYGGLWHPLGLYGGDTMVGFAMWAHDPDEDTHWIGGFLIDRNQQRRGYGRASILALIEWLRSSQGGGDLALSYTPDNEVAARLYASVGFRETGEREGDEVVARLRA